MEKLNVRQKVKCTTNSRAFFRNNNDNNNNDNNDNDNNNNNNLKS